MEHNLIVADIPQAQSSPARTRAPTSAGRFAVRLLALPACLLLMHCGQDAEDSMAAADATSTGGGSGSGGASGSGGGSTGGSGGSSAKDGGIDIDASTETGGASGAGGSQMIPTAAPAVHLIHASPDLHAFRVCVTADGDLLDTLPLPSDPAHPIPYTNYTGVAIGGALELTDLIPDQASEIQLHVIDASIPRVAGSYDGAANEVGCRDLICTGATTCLDPSDVITFGGILKSELDAEVFKVLVMEGCLTGTGAPVTLDASRCGPSFNGTDSNLELRQVGFSPYLTTSDVGITAYAVALAPTLNALHAGKTFRVSYGVLGNTDEQVTLASSVTGIPSPADDPPMPLPTDDADYHTQGLIMDAVGGPEDLQTVLAASWSNIVALQEPDAVPSDFLTRVSGQLFVIVGDATGEPEPWLDASGNPNPKFDGRGLHIVALPLREPIPQ